MRRRTLDALLTTGGLIMAAVLLVAGGLLTWASSFVGDNVHSQLADQKITMPSGKAIEDPLIKPYLAQYAGQQLTTGAQAKAFADHYIKVHMDKASQGRTYEEVSGEYIALSDEDKASEEGQALAGLRQTLFMGNTLRGELLTAYAFAKLGTIAGYAAIASFAGAAFLFALGLMGLVHAKRARETAAVASAKVGTPATV